MIKTIKWKNHPILGNLKLDFSKDNGGIYNTIVFAGENGCGKTTILESISEFLNLRTMEYIEYIIYTVKESNYMIEPQEDNNGIKYGFHIRTNLNNGSKTNIFNGKNTTKNNIKNDEQDLRYYGCAYSKARSGFATKRVTSTTTSQLDENKYDDDSSDDFTSIKQLIIDIDTQDNSDWMEITKKNKGISYEEFEKNSKISRFTNSFNNFFETMKFVKVDNSYPTEKRILFEKNEKLISIDELSTGEKQIVFRGIHILKNVNSLSSGTILIDEPELSLHPRWQKKIFEYYRGLFINDNNFTAQVLIATHSEYVVKSALEKKDDVLVIILKNNKGIIEQHNITAPIVLPTITSAEINYLAFGITSPDYHIQLYGYLQSKTGNNVIKDCDDYIAKHPKFIHSIHGINSSYKKTKYQTLPTFVRNSIDHPSTTDSYTEEQLENSIQLLCEICK